MVPNCGAKILELAARSGHIAPCLGVFLAGLPVEITQCVLAEMVENPSKSSGGLVRPCVLGDHILSVDCDYVGDRDGSGVTVADARSSCVIEVVAQGAFSLSNFALACTSAALDVAVPDDPDGLFDEPSICITSGWLEVQARAFASTRHSFLISAMALRVV
jgi:hypothetical protein